MAPACCQCQRQCQRQRHAMPCHAFPLTVPWPAPSGRRRRHDDIAAAVPAIAIATLLLLFCTVCGCRPVVSRFGPGSCAREGRRRVRRLKFPEGLPFSAFCAALRCSALLRLSCPGSLFPSSLPSLRLTSELNLASTWRVWRSSNSAQKHKSHIMMRIMQRCASCDHRADTTAADKWKAAHIWRDGPYYPSEMRGGWSPVPVGPCRCLPAVHLMKGMSISQPLLSCTIVRYSTSRASPGPPLASITTLSATASHKVTLSRVPCNRLI